MTLIRSRAWEHLLTNSTSDEIDFRQSGRTPIGAAAATVGGGEGQPARRPSPATARRSQRRTRKRGYCNLACDRRGWQPRKLRTGSSGPYGDESSFRIRSARSNITRICQLAPPVCLATAYTGAMCANSRWESWPASSSPSLPIACDPLAGVQSMLGADGVQHRGSAKARRRRGAPQTRAESQACVSDCFADATSV